MPTSPSCAGLPSSCGPGVDEECCTSLTVAGGTYYRSYDGNNYTDKSNPATVSDFRLDRFEVTVGRFRAFVDANMGTQTNPPSVGDGAHPLIAGSGWYSNWNGKLAASKAALISYLKCDASYQTWTDSAGAGETLPINCVSWYEAFAFCIWDGGRLPTEAEWNYAAAGGNDQREYPWGSGIEPSYAVYDCMGDNLSGCSSADILPVGSKSPKGDGKWGHSDLGGSMWEWNLDWYASYLKQCNDCANLATASYRVFRGGSWYDTGGNLLAGGRLSAYPVNRAFIAGVRCARTP